MSEFLAAHLVPSSIVKLAAITSQSVLNRFMTASTPFGLFDQTQKMKRPDFRWLSLKSSGISVIGILACTINYTSATNYYTTQGVVMWHQGQCKEAVKVFHEALKSDLNNADAYYGRGVADQCLGQYGAAVKDFSTAIRLDPQEGDTGSQRKGGGYYNRAHAYE